MQLFATLRRSSRRTKTLLALALTSVLLPASLYAWGPSRPTFTTQTPASYVTFNSITNNPAHGDERNFMRVREATAPNSTYTDEIAVTPGKEYVVYVYYHNNASSSLNDAAHQFAGIAKGAYARAKVPAVLKQGTSAKAVAHVGAANAKPADVFDDITLKNASNGDIALRYVPGSTTIHSHGAVNGKTLPDTMLHAGVSLGYNALDGTLPGCHEYAGYITFRVKADQPNFSFAKQVRTNGDTQWHESVKAQPGATVQYRLEYKNIGSTEQRDVMIQDALPKGVNYIAGSTKLYSGSFPQGKALADGITQQGVNIGHYAPASNAVVVFAAKVDGQLACGTTTLHNHASVITKNGRKSDGADVTVDKQCQPPQQPQPVYTCDALTVHQASANSFKFSVKYGYSNGATFKQAVYKIYNHAGQEVYSSADGAFNGLQPGTYTVKAFVTFAVGGQDKTITSEACAKQITVKGEDKPKTPRVVIDKKVNTAEHKVVGVNTPFAYHIRVTNTGEVPLTNVVVKDTAPRGVVFTGASQGVVKDNAWSHTISELPVGKAVTFVITAKVPTYVAGVITNMACVDAPAVPSKPGTPDGCDTATIEVQRELVEVCNTKTGVIEKITKQDAANGQYTTDLSKCDKVKVCDLHSKTIVTVTRQQAGDAGKYRPADDPACQPKPPVTPPQDPTPTPTPTPTPETPAVPQTPATPAEPHSPAAPNAPAAPAPETPTELPRTGADVLLGGIGLSALFTAAIAYVTSRRYL